MKHILILLSLGILPLYGINKIAVIFVVDGLSHDVLKRTKPFLSGGLKHLLENSVVYESAHFPYAGTSTGPGHTTISTGCLPKVHGIVDNSWYNQAGNKIKCTSDAVLQAAVFSPNGTYSFGASAKHIVADSISDQLVLDSTAKLKNYCAAITGKDRAAICMAGRLGKAIWLDKKSGMFISSKAYFDQMPQWLTKVNKKHTSVRQKPLQWKPIFPITHDAYGCTVDQYDFARRDSLFGKTSTINPEDKNAFNLLIKYPDSNKMILDCGRAYIEQIRKAAEKPHNVILWIGLSGLDKIAHDYGPDSKEYVDTIYHIDKQLESFIDYIERNAGAHTTLFGLTADHGNFSIPELLQHKGFTLARRIMIPEVQHKLNHTIEKRLGIKDLVLKIDTPSIFLDEPKLAELPLEKREFIMALIKEKLAAIHGIKEVWTFDQLAHLCTQADDLTNFYKNQLYPKRSGQIQYQLLPYSFMSKTEHGSSHSSPYNYTTRVPLLIMNKNHTAKVVTKRVQMTQLAPTLAIYFDCPKPSACIADPLPTFRSN